MCKDYAYNPKSRIQNQQRQENRSTNVWQQHARQMDTLLSHSG